MRIQLYILFIIRPLYYSNIPRTYYIQHCNLSYSRVYNNIRIIRLCACGVLDIHMYIDSMHGLNRIILQTAIGGMSQRVQ